MCGRFTHALDWRDIVELYRLTQPAPPDGWRARYNLAPSQDAPVVRADPETGGRAVAMLKWGLVPFWAKEAKVGYSMINARAETVASKPAYREAFRRRRCLVPASGFYEWRAEGSGPKQPYHFCCAEGGPMTFAGLWERWEKGAEPLETFTIVVGPANDQVRPYHDRMPAILDPAQWDAWLDPASPADALQALLQPYPGALTIQPVSRAVNNPRNDAPTLLEPAGP